MRALLAFTTGLVAALLCVAAGALAGALGG